jgi:hypothetical protein
MARPPFPSLLFNPFALWMDLALKTAETLFASGLVIGTRVNRMQLAGPNPSARDRKEFTLMGTEKLKAMTDSAMAVGLRMHQSQLHLLSAALQPFHTASTGNARRLARPRRRARG